MTGTRSRQDSRRSRHRRIRKRISGTGARPRMAIMVSNKHIYVQFIDDTVSSTLAAVSTMNNGGAGATVSKAKVLGERAAEAAKAAGIGSAVVDRGGFAYHGRVKALVEAASEGGLDVGIKTGETAKVKNEKPSKKESAASVDSEVAEEAETGNEYEAGKESGE